MTLDGFVAVAAEDTECAVVLVVAMAVVDDTDPIAVEEEPDAVMHHAAEEIDIAVVVLVDAVVDAVDAAEVVVDLVEVFAE